MDAAMFTCSQPGDMSDPGRQFAGGGGPLVPLQATRLSGPVLMDPQHLQHQHQPQQQHHPGNIVGGGMNMGAASYQSCAGCGGKIQDRVMLNAVDRLWHTECLKCSCCQMLLNDLGSSFYARGNMLLCRKDYVKMFGTTGTCASCHTAIPADELVMRCQGTVYHLKCFVCVQCHNPLQPGEKFSLVNGNLFCEHEFPKLFGPGGTQALTSSSSSSTTTTTTSTTKGKQKKVDNRRYPLPVC